MLLQLCWQWCRLYAVRTAHTLPLTFANEVQCAAGDSSVALLPVDYALS